MYVCVCFNKLGEKVNIRDKEASRDCRSTGWALGVGALAKAFKIFLLIFWRPLHPVARIPNAWSHLEV